MNVDRLHALAAEIDADIERLRRTETELRREMDALRKLLEENEGTGNARAA